jgi:hypothetical protein
LSPSREEPPLVRDEGVNLSTWEALSGGTVTDSCLGAADRVTGSDTGAVFSKGVPHMPQKR